MTFDGFNDWDDKEVPDLVVATAQIAMKVGDIEHNKAKILEYAALAEASSVDVVVFPELTLCGYPPEDLLLKPHFIEANIEALDWVCESTASLGVALVIGYVDKMNGKTYNCAAFIHEGKIIHTHRKVQLPTYDVFDEDRYFDPGEHFTMFNWNDNFISLAICEDVWHIEPWIDDMEETTLNPDVILVLNASPYHARKTFDRQAVVMELAFETNSTVIYCNAAGAQDELVFDGGSLGVDEQRALIGRAPQFEEAFSVFDILTNTGPACELLGDDEELLTAIISGTRRYVTNNGFEDVVIGLSGGIDSALVAYVAVEALGPNRVHTIAMPSKYSSDESLIDAEELAKSLKIHDHRIISIDKAVHAYDTMFVEYFAGLEPDITEENLQARIRGNILMAMSNKFGWMVLSTGNKSETAVGYSTLYGDMCGGFNPIKDVYKTRVYDLCRYINRDQEVIPVRTLEKPPSAELSPGQKDVDRLPPYNVLDPILREYIENDKSAVEIQRELGVRPDIVNYVINLVDKAEYKRRQAPPGVRVTPKAFGKDRRMPITNAFKETLSIGD